MEAASADQGPGPGPEEQTDAKVQPPSCRVRGAGRDGERSPSAPAEFCWSTCSLEPTTSTLHFSASSAVYCHLGSTCTKVTGIAVDAVVASDGLSSSFQVAAVWASNAPKPWR